MPKVCPLGAAQKILKLQSWRAANVYCQKVTCLAKKNRDYVGKRKVPRVRCMTRRPKKKTSFFSACVTGAGDVGRDCSPSPPSSLLHSTAVNKSIINSQRQSLQALTMSIIPAAVHIHLRAGADDQPKGPSVVTPCVGVGLGRGALNRNHRAFGYERVKTFVSVSLICLAPKAQKVHHRPE
jgi:hypothetical protein